MSNRGRVEHPPLPPEEPLPEYREATLTLDQLEDLVAGRARLMNPYGAELLRLDGDQLNVYRAAQTTCFCLLGSGDYSWPGYSLPDCWRHYCRLKGQPHAIIVSFPGHKQAEVRVRPRQGVQLPLEKAPGLAVLAGAILGEGDRLQVGPSEVVAQVLNAQAAVELVTLLIDRVQELEVPEDPAREFRFNRRGRQMGAVAREGAAEVGPLLGARPCAGGEP
jgi:hypothetical protein